MVGILASVSANADYVEFYTHDCDMNAMRAELNRAVAARRAVITKVICEETVAEPVMYEDTCGETVESVINREYFVRETVQQYKPVIHYEPADQYVTFRAVCDGAECK